jgi:hypothetical protein
VPFHFAFIFQLRATPNLLSAASSSVFRFLFLASQASDVGSIPIARSIKPVDAVGFTGFRSPNCPMALEPRGPLAENCPFDR